MGKRQSLELILKGAYIRGWEWCAYFRKELGNYYYLPRPNRKGRTPIHRVMVGITFREEETGLDWVGLGFVPRGKKVPTIPKDFLQEYHRLFLELINKRENKPIVKQCSVLYPFVIAGKKFANRKEVQRYFYILESMATFIYLVDAAHKDLIREPLYKVLPPKKFKKEISIKERREEEGITQCFDKFCSEEGKPYAFEYCGYTYLLSTYPNLEREVKKLHTTLEQERKWTYKIVANHQRIIKKYYLDDLDTIPEFKAIRGYLDMTPEQIYEDLSLKIKEQEGSQSP